MNNTIIPQQPIIPDIATPNQILQPQINQNITISGEQMDKSKKKNFI
jgi:hypothetical protein